MKCWAFVPGHVSGFFQPVISPSPYRTGSRNFGPCLSLGVWTCAENGDGIYLNDREAEIEPTGWVLRRLGVRVRIRHYCQVPLGSGFGASGAFALGTALATARLLGLKARKRELVRIAHEAEVTCRTGLGDVGPQSLGGVVVTTRAGAPPYGKWRRLRTGKVRILCANLGPIRTKDLLRDEEFLRKARALGGRALRKVLARPTLGRAMEASLEFSKSLGLLDRELEGLIRVCRREGVLASQIMLGRGIFCFVPQKKMPRVKRGLVEVLGREKVLSCRVGGGAEIKSAPRGRPAKAAAS